MTRLHYHLVDVFTGLPFAGNPLAVFTRGEGIPPGAMQAIARELNLSESAFVLPADDPANNYRLRIFTPGSEMLMAGHPTIGTSFVLARESMVPRTGDVLNLRLEEGVGPIGVRLEYEQDELGMIWMSQPLPLFGPRSENRTAAAEMLSLPPESLDPELPIEVVSCGVPFLYVPLRDLGAIRAVRFRQDVWDRAFSDLGAHGLFLLTREVENRGSTVHSRMFAPELGVAEDPGTGAASGPLGCYLLRYGAATPQDGTARMLSEQGIELGRPSFIHIEIDAEHAGEDSEITGVRIGGRCVSMGGGYLDVGLEA